MAREKPLRALEPYRRDALWTRDRAVRPAERFLGRVVHAPTTLTPEDTILWRCMQVCPGAWHNNAYQTLTPLETASGCDLAWLRRYWPTLRSVAWLGMVSGLGMAPVTVVDCG